MATEMCISLITIFLVCVTVLKNERKCLLKLIIFKANSMAILSHFLKKTPVFLSNENLSEFLTNILCISLYGPKLFSMPPCMSVTLKSSKGYCHMSNKSYLLLWHEGRLFFSRGFSSKVGQHGKTFSI